MRTNFHPLSSIEGLRMGGSSAKDLLNKLGPSDGVVSLSLDEDVLSVKDRVFDCFRSSNFKLKEPELIAHHEFSHELDYLDSKTGITVTVNKITNAVLAIGFAEVQPLGLVKCEVTSEK